VGLYAGACEEYDVGEYDVLESVEDENGLYDDNELKLFDTLFDILPKLDSALFNPELKPDLAFSVKSLEPENQVDGLNQSPPL
jgi:hypothetical protein